MATPRVIPHNPAAQIGMTHERLYQHTVLVGEPVVQQSAYLQAPTGTQPIQPLVLAVPTGTQRTVGETIQLLDIYPASAYQPVPTGTVHIQHYRPTVVRGEPVEPQFQLVPTGTVHIPPCRRIVVHGVPVEHLYLLVPTGTAHIIQHKLTVPTGTQRTVGETIQLLDIYPASAYQPVRTGMTHEQLCRRTVLIGDPVVVSAYQPVRTGMTRARLCRRTVLIGPTVYLLYRPAATGTQLTALYKPTAPAGILQVAVPLYHKAPTGTQRMDGVTIQLLDIYPAYQQVLIGTQHTALCKHTARVGEQVVVSAYQLAATGTAITTPRKPTVQIGVKHIQHYKPTVVHGVPLVITAYQQVPIGIQHTTLYKHTVLVGEQVVVSAYPLVPIGTEITTPHKPTMTAGTPNLLGVITILLVL